MYGDVQPYTISIMCPECKAYTSSYSNFKTKAMSRKHFFFGLMGVREIIRLAEERGERTCSVCNMPYIITHIKYGKNL